MMLELKCVILEPGEKLPQPLWYRVDLVLERVPDGFFVKKSRYGKHGVTIKVVEVETLAPSRPEPSYDRAIEILEKIDSGEFYDDIDLVFLREHVGMCHQRIKETSPTQE